jgi:hypothetical protein
VTTDQIISAVAMLCQNELTLLHSVEKLTRFGVAAKPDNMC